MGFKLLTFFYFPFLQVLLNLFLPWFKVFLYQLPESFSFLFDGRLFSRHCPFFIEAITALAELGATPKDIISLFAQVCWWVLYLPIPWGTFQDKIFLRWLLVFSLCNISRIHPDIELMLDVVSSNWNKWYLVFQSIVLFIFGENV